jgi:biopolymer transport protein ExbD
MRIPARSITSEVGFNMTPMIDVVFQLIIFFLLSSHLARQETRLALPLPRAESGSVQADNDRPRLTVNVLADGTLLVANRSITGEGLANLFAQRRAVHGDALEVRIRADRAVPYSRVEPVMMACVSAGISKVAYAVFQKE